jgi:hypothetical protein
MKVGGIFQSQIFFRHKKKGEKKRGKQTFFERKQIKRSTTTI